VGIQKRYLVLFIFLILALRNIPNSYFSYYGIIILSHALKLAISGKLRYIFSRPISLEDDFPPNFHGDPIPEFIIKNEKTCKDITKE